jgi:Ca-activated chloride channel family protein
MGAKIRLRSVIVVIFSIVLSVNLSGQVTFSTFKHDFGTLEPYDERFVDITLTNKGQKKEYVLTVKKPGEVVYVINGKFMDKDSSIFLRLQVNPKVKGKFTYDVEVFTSDRTEPVIVKLTGIIKEPAQDDMSMFTTCPDFNSRPSGRSQQFDLTVVTIDKETKAELSNTMVAMIQNGMPVWNKNTDKSGKIKEDATLGFSYFYAKHEAYKPAELGAYVNFQRNYIVIELEKDPSYCPPPPVVPVHPTDVAEVPVEIEIKKELESKVELPVSAPVELSALDPNDFSAAHFDPVNVIFVLDVSSSMQQGEKLELMKYSLYQLTDMLRPGDKMGIVTYATDTRVLLAPTDGSNKEDIRGEIEKLKASGLTAGGEGIKLGYKQALKSYLPNGVNQVIVITDGAFNRNSDDYMKYVKKYKKKGVNMSVVGVGIKEPDKVKMQEAAEKSGGSFIQILKLADAQNKLKQEIRVLTFKRKSN